LRTGTLKEHEAGNPKARKYYETADFSLLWIIDRTFFKHRQIRVKCGDRWVKGAISMGRGPEALRRFLWKWAPDRSYYMVGRFLNPGKIGARNLKGEPTYQMAYNLFLKQDRFVFDLDDGGKSLGDLLHLLRIMRLELIYVLKTYKGYHVCIKWTPDVAFIENPIEREMATRELNRVLIEKVREYGVECDDTSDPRQLVRIPLSWCEEMDGPLPLIYPEEGVGSLFGDDMVAFKPKVPERGTLPLPAPSGRVQEGKGGFIHVITNNITDIGKARVPIVSFPDEKKAMKFIEREELPYYAFKDLSGRIWLLSPIVFHERDLLRYYRNRGLKREYEELKKYHHNVMPLRALKNPLFYKCEVRHETFLSRGHMNLLRKIRWNLPKGVELGGDRVHVRLFVDQRFLKMANSLEGWFDGSS